MARGRAAGTRWKTGSSQNLGNTACLIDPAAIILALTNEGVGCSDLIVALSAFSLIADKD